MIDDFHRNESVIFVFALWCVFVYLYSPVYPSQALFIFYREHGIDFISMRKNRRHCTANSCANNFDSPSIMAFTALFKISKCHKQFFILFTVPISTLSTVSLNCYKEDFQVDLQKHTSQFTITFFYYYIGWMQRGRKKKIFTNTLTQNNLVVVFFSSFIK